MRRIKNIAKKAVLTLAVFVQGVLTALLLIHRTEGKNHVLQDTEKWILKIREQRKDFIESSQKRALEGSSLSLYEHSNAVWTSVRDGQKNIEKEFDDVYKNFKAWTKADYLQGEEQGKGPAKGYSDSVSGDGGGSGEQGARERNGGSEVFDDCGEFSRNPPLYAPNRDEDTF